MDADLNSIANYNAGCDSLLWADLVFPAAVPAIRVCPVAVR